MRRSPARALLDEAGGGEALDEGNDLHLAAPGLNFLRAHDVSAS